MTDSADSAFRGEDTPPYKIVRDAAIASFRRADQRYQTALRELEFGREGTSPSRASEQDSHPPGAPGVPGQDLGPEVTCPAKSLKEAIENHCILEIPPWGHWQVWRRDVGFRPREPSGMRSAFRLREGRLHPELMEHFHGNEWRTKLESLENEATTLSEAG